MTYVTLRRLGLGEQAEAIADHQHEDRHRRLAGDIGPQSPRPIGFGRPGRAPPALQPALLISLLSALVRSWKRRR